MSVRESPWSFVATIGGVGVLAWTLTVFFVFAFPLLAVPEAAQPALFDAWADSVATLGDSAFAYSVPLLVVVVGYLLVRTSK